MRPDLYKDLFEKEETYWWNVSKREMVRALLNTARIERGREKLLGVDIGCGAGFTTKFFDPEWRMVAADVSRSALELCQRRGLENLCQVDMMNFSLPFKTASVDLVLALDVIEHIDDDIQALAECRRILKEGGSLVITVPAFMALWSPWDEILGHKRRYSVAQLVGALQKAGFSIRTSSYIFFFVFPAAVLIRTVKKLFQKDAANYTTDFIQLPKILNSFLVHVGQLEQWMTTILKIHFPFGLSAISFATKKTSRLA